MSDVVTERGVQLLGTGPEMAISPTKDGVVFLLRNDGIAHYARFDPDEADALALMLVRQAERARAMNQAAQAITPVVSAKKANGANGSGRPQ